MTALPHRRGTRPHTNLDIPHQQLDQQPSDPTILDRLAEHILTRPGIHSASSVISLPGARAFVVTDPDPDAPARPSSKAPSSHTSTPRPT